MAASHPVPPTRGPMPSLRPVLLTLFFVLPGLLAALPAQDWAGKWYTTRGVLTLEAGAEGLTGRYGDGGKNTLTGKAGGRKLAYEAKEGDTQLTGELELQANDSFFNGAWRSGNGEGTWRGWRADPKAKLGRAARVQGPWRTSWGLLELEQQGDKLSGGFGAQGWSKVSGTIRGRAIELRYETPFGNGTFAVDVQPDGKAAYGAATGDRGEWPLQWQRLEGHAENVTPKPAAIVSGLARNRLTYHVRAPKGWKPGAAPMVVILHGSNMSSRPYVESIAAVPAVADRYLIVGIDGEQWQDWSSPDDPRHNYTYVNWMGRSTYQGYPNTHRESPALVAELLQDLKAQCKPDRVFVGGHSQGGFLTWFLAMHFQGLVDGIFPMSCGLVIQCEPDVFEDAALKQAQRRVAIAVVHGSNDPVVAFSQGRSSFQSFQEQDFPTLRLFQNQAGHGFSSLPWPQALEWLSTMSSPEPEVLLQFAESSMDDARFRDAGAALQRTAALQPKGAMAKRHADLSARLDEYAEHDGKRLLAAIQADTDGAWIDDFLEYRDSFGTAAVAQPTLAAFALLRQKHEKPAQELFGEARKRFQQGDRDGGWEKYDELVRTCYASSLYRRVKGWLLDRR